MRGWGCAVAAVVTLAGGLAIVPAGAAQPPAPLRPIPAPAHVQITDGGYSPASVMLTVGQTVEFDNTGTHAQTVTSDDATFDSGEIPPGGAFSIAIGTADFYTFASTDNAAFTGTLIVGSLGLVADPSALVQSVLPKIDIPPPDALDEEPNWGLGASRNRILLQFDANTTVAQANAALEGTGGIIVGTLPDINLALVEIPDPGTGNFDPVENAIDVLRANGTVSAAALDVVQKPAIAPAPPESAFAGPDASPTSWTWQDFRQPGDAPRGLGGNWGLEASRFPQAWNLFDRLKPTAGSKVDTLVLDEGFVKHADVNAKLVVMCQTGVPGGVAPARRCAKDVDPDNAQHGTHVSGIIGAAFNNPSPEPGHALGIDGANPWVNLYQTPVSGLSQTVHPKTGFTSIEADSALSEVIKGKAGGLWPNLGVMNYSLGEFDFTADPGTGTLKWVRLFANKHCGLLDAPDGPTATGPCTFQNENKFRAEVAAIGKIQLDLAKLASRAGIEIVAAASNDSEFLCIAGNTLHATPCAAGQEDRESAKEITGFGWAEAHWDDPPAQNNILTIEAYNALLHRAIQPGNPSFSNVGGDVSAPGQDVLSTIGAPKKYAAYPGTSMAAPHVTALVGMLLAYKNVISGGTATFSAGELRHLIVDYARNDVLDGGAPRIDAYASMIAAGAAKSIVDVNDASLDGNKRILRGSDGTEIPRLDVGESISVPNADGTVSRVQLHSAPDNEIDMRDFRRYRDAVLQACTVPGVDSTGCPADPSSIRLDGAADNPRFDLNWDGCVAGTNSACLLPESKFSRFDFNGDGSLNPTKTARLPLHGTDPSANATDGDSLTDLQVLSAFFDNDPAKTEGWSSGQLPQLMSSGDLEVHATSLFRAGAKSVDLHVRYGVAGTAAPDREIKSANETAIVTVPVGSTGDTVRITGTGFDADGKKVNSSFTEVQTLLPGADSRVDLCTPNLVATATDGKTLYDDGTDASTISVSLDRCGRDPIVDQDVDFHLARLDNTAPASTLSAFKGKTDKAGRVKVKVTAGHEREKLGFVVSTKLAGTPGDPTSDQQIDAEIDLDVVSPPHIIYRWEQNVTDWHENLRSHEDATAGFPEVNKVGTQTGVPMTLARSGSLTPVADGTDARLVETAPPNKIAWQEHVVDTVSGQTTDTNQSIEIPDHFNHVDANMSSLVVKSTADDGDTLPVNEWKRGSTSFDTTDSSLTVHNFNDIGGVGYGYEADPTQNCRTNVFCLIETQRDQVALADRLHGSAIEYATDLTKDLTFTKLPNGKWSSYVYCGKPHTYDNRGYSGSLSSLFSENGAATSSARFVATVVDDNTDPSTLQFGDCTDAKPPISAISRFPIEANEGQLVHFVDASSDPNGDVVAWEWDFGDGATSTEQFPDHTYTDNGTYTVSLKVTDATGKSDTTTVDETVKNLPPEINVQDVAIDSGQPVNVPLTLFDAGERDGEALQLSFSSADSDVPNYPPITIPSGTSTLNLGVIPDGAHDLTLTATDKDGAAATATFAITVGDGTAGTVEPDPDIESTPASQCDFGVKLDIGESDAVDLISKYRSANGESAIFPSPTLTAAAEAQAAYLRDHDQFSHAGDGGSTPLDRALAAAYPGTLVGENLVRGVTTAPGAVVAWKSSPSHNANMLNPAWRAIGIAKVTTVHGTLWVTDYGNDLDCPALPPDLGPGGGPADPIIAPNPPNPPIEVLAWSGARSAAAPAAPAPSDVPVSAFTVSNRFPSSGAPVTITNRSGSAGLLEPGDGRPGAALAAGASITTSYLQPGTAAATLTVGALAAQLGVVVGGSALPPTVTNAGPVGGGQQANVTLSALVQTGAHVAVSGRTVDFSVAGKVAHGVTDVAGRASAAVKLDVAPGGYQLKIDVPKLQGAGVDATTTVPFTVVANGPPVARAGGPYSVLVGDPLVLDASTSFDPEAHPVTGAWDLNNDGVFDDATDIVPAIPGAQVAQLVCGGVCAVGVAFPIAVRITDDKGAESTAATTVTFSRDFALTVNPGNVTLNPGGSASLQVQVVTTSGFAQPVVLSVPNLPAGVTAAFSPPSVIPNGSSVLTLTAAANASKLNVPITVRGVGGGVTHDASGTVDVEFGLVPQCFTAIDVHVVDKETNAPVAGAFVAYGGVFTDASGNARVGHIGLPPGNGPLDLFLGANKTGYFTGTGEQIAACGVVTALEIRLLRQHTGVLTGRVVVGVPDPNDHSPSRAVTPTDQPIVGADAVGATTDANGHYQIDNYPVAFDNQPFVGFATYNADGYTFEQKLITVNPDAVTTVDAALVPKCTGSVDIRVLDKNTRKPISGMTVSTNNLGGTSHVTGPDGRVIIARVPLGARNSSVTQPASVFTIVNGRSVTASTAVTVFDCGSVGVADILLPTPIERRATLEGDITDDTGAVVPNAFVLVDVGAGVRADENGHYVVPNFVFAIDTPIERDSQVSATPDNNGPDNWYALQKTAHLVDGQTTTLDFVLVRRKFGHVSGLVRDAVTLEPIAGAHIDNVPGADTSGPDGRFLSGNVRLGPNNAPVGASAVSSLQGYFPGSALFDVKADETTSVTLDMLRRCAPVSVTGRVINAATGLPLEGATVSRNDGTFSFTDAQGHYSVDNIVLQNNQPFSVTLFAQKEGFFTATRTVTVFCGSHLSIDFGDEASGVGAVHGVVTKKSDGSPIAGATVGGDWGKVTTTAADGTYSFAGVPIGGEPAGGWGVHVQAPIHSGLSDATKSVVVTANHDSALDFQLVPPTNRRPVAQAQNIAIGVHDSLVQVNLTGTDPDGDPLTFRAFGATGGTLDINSTLQSRTLFLDSGVTTATFFYVVSDGALDSAAALITITRPADTTTTTTTTTTTSTTTTSTTTTTVPPSSTTTTTTTALPPATTTTVTEPTTTTTVPPTSTTTSTTTVPPTSTSTSTSTTTTTVPVASSSSTSSTTVEPESTTTSTVGPSSTTSSTVHEQGGGSSTSTSSSTVAALGSTSSTAVSNVHSSGDGSLPFTGGNSSGIIAFAISCVVGGGLLVRRRRPGKSQQR